MPLDAIFELWDVIIPGPRCLLLFFGISVLISFRDKIINSDFDECIVIFSNFPAIDVKACTKKANQLFSETPHSITSHSTPPENDAELGEWLALMVCVPVPFISFEDVQRLQNVTAIIDVRQEALFRKGHLPNAIQLSPSKMSKVIPKLKEFQVSSNSTAIIAIVASHQSEASEVSEKLGAQGIKNVCIIKEFSCGDHLSAAELVGIELETTQNNAQNIVSGVVGMMTLGVIGNGEMVNSLIPNPLSTFRSRVTDIIQNSTN
eukprot:c14305_g1_i2.p1 GENE.c14305_g1_i2~~c14305_g1_i2.p1  ORF type:complete len:262 (-),score=121.82 c14305_g1_i2:26-811(-)